MDEFTRWMSLHESHDGEHVKACENEQQKKTPLSHLEFQLEMAKT